MSTREPSASPAFSSKRIAVRDVLAAAWPLSQVCLPTCLPLAIAGVAASALPGALTTARGESFGHVHSGVWWAVLAASLLLTLVCYGAMLGQQMAAADGRRPALLHSVRNAVVALPSLFGMTIAGLLVLLPAIAFTAWRGFDLAALALTGAGAGLLVYLLPAWPLILAGPLGPVAALTGSIRLVQGQWLQFAGVVLSLLAGTLVFALLASILISMVMNLAGQGQNPTAGALAFSRWLIAIVLALPVMYGGAAVVMAWRSASHGGNRGHPG